MPDRTAQVVRRCEDCGRLLVVWRAQRDVPALWRDSETDDGEGGGSAYCSDNVLHVPNRSLPIPARYRTEPQADPLASAPWTRLLRSGPTEPGGPGIVPATSSINVLRAYEAEHGVTFVALDTAALRAVHEAYALPQDAQGYAGADQQRERWAALEDAVAALLGLA